VLISSSWIYSLARVRLLQCCSHVQVFFTTLSFWGSNFSLQWMAEVQECRKNLPSLLKPHFRKGLLSLPSPLYWPNCIIWPSLKSVKQRMYASPQGKGWNICWAIVQLKINYKKFPEQFHLCSIMATQT
jgi:hypothetical protein